MSDRVQRLDRCGDAGGLRRARLVPALIALLALASSAHAESALGQLPDMQAAPNLSSLVPHAAPATAPTGPVQASQLAAQVAEAAQATGADAAVLQAQPTNIAIPSIVASPGGDAVVLQTNEAPAGAEATNGNAIAQGSGQSQVGGGDAGSSGGAPSLAQGGAQVAQTSQASGAQAVTVQNHPVNVAIPIVVNSPNSNSIVVQANTAAAAAAASNTSSTAQIASQTQVGGDSAGRQDGQEPSAYASPASQTGSTPLPQVAQEAVAAPAENSIWIWIWDWEWNWTVPGVGAPEASVPGVSVPPLAEATTSLPVPTLPVANLPVLPPSLWTLPGSAALSILDWTSAEPFAGFALPSLVDSSILPALAGIFEAVPQASAAESPGGARPEPGAGAGAVSPQAPTTTFQSGIERLEPPTLSSSFVQTPAMEGKTRGRPLQTADTPLPVPVPGHSAPSGSGGVSVSPSGLVLGALVLLALQLASAAFALGRRFDLASAAWRRQAYLSPLERPG